MSEFFVATLLKGIVENFAMLWFPHRRDNLEKFYPRPYGLPSGGQIIVTVQYVPPAPRHAGETSYNVTTNPVYSDEVVTV